MSNYYDEIEQYLDGELPENAHQEFEQRLSNDPRLAAEVSILKEARQRISHQLAETEELNIFKNHLQEFTPTNTNTSAKVRKLSFRRLSIYAGGIVATIALLIFVWPTGSKSLFEQNAQHPTFSVTERGGSEQEIVKKATQLFNSEDYTAALPYVQEYRKSHPEDTEVLLFEGICLLEIDQTKDAMAIFQSLSQSKSLSKADGEWYLALTYLKMAEEGDNSYVLKSKEVLKNISPTSVYYDRAQILLQNTFFNIK